MDVISVTVWIFIIILVFIFILWLFGTFTTEPQPQINIEQLIHIAEEKGNWQKPVPVPNSDRSSCNVYTFPTDSVPTTEQSVVDSLTPVPTDVEGCTDSDQLALSFVQRTCGRADNQASGCVGNNGKTYKRGEIEKFYTRCNIPQCKDSNYAAVAMDFAPEPEFGTRPTVCLQAAASVKNIPNLTTETCAISNADQFFRITRTNSKDLTPSDSGVYAKILDRESGKCVIKDPVSKTDLGSNVVLGDCTPNSGYVWFLAPPVQVTVNSNTTVTPQQLLYTDKFFDKLPKASKIVEFVQKNDLNSLFPFSTTTTPDSQPTLQAPSTDGSGTPGEYYNIQFMNLQIYDAIQYTQPQVQTSTGNTDVNFPFYVWN